MPNRRSETDEDFDRAAMARLLADQPEAIDAIIERHGPALHAYLIRWMGNAEDARDLALETFVRVHQHRARFDPTRSLATWLYSIATNLARDRHRWRLRHPETAFLAIETNPGLDGESSLQDSRSDPALTLLREERAIAVRRAIDTLPDDLRTVILLSEFESLSNAEIASILQCTVKAVEMRLYRARHNLRNQLAAFILDPE
ncbi:MAG: RNA polymerase sigma factor [Limisphaerales bacterium]